MKVLSNMTPYDMMLFPIKLYLFWMEMMGFESKKMADEDWDKIDKLFGGHS